MSSQVVRTVQYGKGSLGAIGREVGRTEQTAEQFRNPDIDASRTHTNVVFKDAPQGMYAAWKDACKRLNITNADNIKKNATAFEGFVITSDKAFFDSLGYVPGQPPSEAVLTWANESYNWLVAEYGFKGTDENILAAVLHLDETTPHLQVYGIPVVDSWKEKVLQYDEQGQVVRNERGSPVQARDKNGKLVWRDVKDSSDRKLSRDAFWKNKGGNRSYSKMQDSYYEAVSKKYGLERGEIGSNREHTDKKVWEAQQLEKKVSKAQKQLDKVEAKTAKLREELTYKDGVIQPSLIPTKYNTKEIKKQNEALQTELKKALKENEELRAEVEQFRTAEAERAADLRDRNGELRRVYDAADKYYALEVYLSRNPAVKQVMSDFMHKTEFAMQYGAEMVAHKQGYVRCEERIKELSKELSELRIERNADKQLLDRVSYLEMRLDEQRSLVRHLTNERADCGMFQNRKKRELDMKTIEVRIDIRKMEAELREQHNIPHTDQAALCDEIKDITARIKAADTREKALETKLAETRKAATIEIGKYRIQQNTLPVLQEEYHSIVKRYDNEYEPPLEHKIKLSPAAKIKDIAPTKAESINEIRGAFNSQNLQPLIDRERAKRKLEELSKPKSYEKAKSYDSGPTR